MEIVIFGLSVSSSWGNGHATIWRGLLKALARRGHHITFFEQDVPYYAKHRDLASSRNFEIVLYRSWEAVRSTAEDALHRSDCSFVTSYCPNVEDITTTILNCLSGIRIYYDLDTPVTLERLQRGERVEYLPACGLAPFDLVLSYTGGRALNELSSRLGARHVMPLYGSVDPEIHRPVPKCADYEADLSYLGTYTADRQSQLERLLLEPARRQPEKRFLIAGALYPQDFPWQENIRFMPHVPPPQHSTFYCSSNLTLNVTRAAMAESGYCPSGRLFEAAACGVPILSDYWQGLENFFEPGKEIIVAADSDQAEATLQLDSSALAKYSELAKLRVMTEHTAEYRAGEFLRMIA